MATANNLLHNMDDAEDAVVFGFTEAMIKCHLYEPGDLGAWLRVAVWRRACVAAKKRTRQPVSLG